MELSFVDEETKEAEDQWLNCLVGYFLGRRPYFNHLKESLSRKWKLIRDLNLYTLENGFFLFKFSNPDECSRVIEDSSHNYGGRPLILQRWEPGISTEKQHLTEVPVWIHLPGLHLKFWSSHCLSQIASLIGKPLYMDTYTTEATRLNYARICVQVSAGQRLPDSIKLKSSTGEMVQRILYDWRPKACDTCCDFSHSTEECSFHLTKMPSQGKFEWRPVHKAVDPPRQQAPDPKKHQSSSKNPIESPANPHSNSHPLDLHRGSRYQAEERELQHPSSNLIYM
ncbi:uncharacterized protein LOC143852379 [Tasmannia lanceolata]|uniref:uncharacterized protein LOC143852379 n=1 Tax=Tasmannia lanceolata TaxID=3420 RepID=UPI004063FEB5